MSPRRRPLTVPAGVLTERTRACEPCPCTDGGRLVAFSLCPSHCAEPDCWGTAGHTGLHADGKTRWTAKGRPALPGARP